MDANNITIYDDRKQFQKEQDDLLFTILDNRYFKTWLPEQPGVDLPPAGVVEIYITAKCNQKCEYCYLQNFESSLYPPEADNHDKIIKNLKAFFDWLLENNYQIPSIEYYGGEIWHSSFGMEILDITLDYIDKGLRLPNGILLPTNGTFLESDKWTQEMQNRINAFRSRNVELVISISIDGKVVEEAERPRKNGARQDLDEWYDKVFTFAKKNHYGFHPMLSAKSAKYWIDNFKWWKQMFRKYEIPIDYLMLLEVRNNDWEDEDIKAYEDFCDYLMQDTISYYNGDYVEALEDLVNLNQTYRTDRENQLLWSERAPYIPIFIAENKNLYGCTLATDLTLRLGDLAICPCHRTAYHKNLYGWFRQDENGKIIGIKANNPQQAIANLFTNRNQSILGCDTCYLNTICLGCCRGQSMEATKDPLRNDPKVCKFLKAKYKIVLKLYKKYGMIDWLEENMSKYHIAYYSTGKPILDAYHAMEEEDKNEYLAKYRQDIYWTR